MMRQLVLSMFTCLVALSVMLPAAVAEAQTADELIRIGNDLYNRKKYSEATSNYAKAIQTDPGNALKAYVNMARALNLLKRYDESVQYYDWYIELTNKEEDKNLRKIEAEAKKARRRAKGDTKVVTESQKTALARLITAMDEGPYLSADGGGALAVYKVLLRTDYATPQLVAIQQRLATGLVDEAIALTVPLPGQPTAQLDSDGWKGVRQRLDSASAFVGANIDTEAVQILDSIARGWAQYYKGNYDESIAFFEEAIALAPGSITAQWGRALALLFVDSGEMTRTFAAIDDVEAAWEAMGRSPWPFVPMLRAAALQSAGRLDEATTILRSL